MADNVVIPAGSGGASVAADDIGGIHVQRVKVQHGADGSASDVSIASPLPSGPLLWNGSAWAAPRIAGAVAVAIDSDTPAVGAYGYDAASNNLKPMRTASRDGEDGAGLIGSGGMVFNGTTWDRAKSVAAADGTSGTGVQGVSPMGLHPNGFYYRVSSASDADGLAAAPQTLAVQTRPTLYNGTTYDRARSPEALGDGAGSGGVAAQTPYLYNGASYDRARGDAANGTDVDVTRSALPTGAATAAKQDTIIGHVDGLEAKDFATQTTLASVLAAVDGLEGLLDTVEALLAAATPAGSNVIGKVDHATTGIGSGRKVVTTAGTRVALAGSTAAKWVTITAETDNTGYVVVGSAAGVIAALATREGTPLAAGDSVTLAVDNLADVGLDSTVSGDGATFSYGT